MTAIQATPFAAEYTPVGNDDRGDTSDSLGDWIRQHPLIARSGIREVPTAAPPPMDTDRTQRVWDRVHGLERELRDRELQGREMEVELARTRNDAARAHALAKATNDNLSAVQARCNLLEEETLRASKALQLIAMRAELNHEPTIWRLAALGAQLDGIADQPVSFARLVSLVGQVAAARVEGKAVREVELLHETAGVALLLGSGAE